MAKLSANGTELLRLQKVAGHDRHNTIVRFSYRSNGLVLRNIGTTYAGRTRWSGWSIHHPKTSIDVMLKERGYTVTGGSVEQYQQWWEGRK